LALVTAFSLSLITIVFLFSAPVMGQATTGRLTGTVADPNGGVVAGATVTAKNDATGTEKRFTTSGDGGFEISDLQPGKYTVTVTPTSGFSTKVLTGVDVKVGGITDLKIALEIGQPSATVTITANTEEVVQTTSQLSSSFETRKVEDLPSNAAGGGIDTLALLAPGVVPGFGNVNSNGVTLSVNGNRARSNNFTLDGTDNNDLTIGGPNFFISNQDSVQEFQIITNNFSAQYGRNQGAVVNIVTKGGSNEFHGSGFEFHRNSSSLDAMTNAERADPARSRRDKFVSNVFGGTFGGPIKKNKAFFFVDGQLIRQRQQFTFSTTSPVITNAGLTALAAQYPGNPAIGVLLNQSLAALRTVRVASSAGTVCFPKDFTLACSGANALLVPAAFVNWDIKLPFDQREYGLRGDFNPTTKDAINTKYRYQQSPETNFLTGSNGWAGDIPFISRNLNGAWTRQFSSHVTNEFKAAWQKLQVTFGGCSAVDSSTTKGCIPDTTLLDKAFTSMSLSGIRAAGVSLQTMGPATNLPQGRQVRVAQFADTLSWVSGKHSVIVGVDFRDLSTPVPFLPNINGNFRFSTTARLVANAPTQVTLVAGDPTINYKERDQFYFFQDNWKVRENLTLELGVRYEYTGSPINKLHDLTVARESNASTAIWLQSLPLAARTFPKIPVDKNNFAPRLGFAWSPRMGHGGFAKALFGENDATVIRGGYSIAYDPAFYNILLNVSTSAPAVFNNLIVNSCTNHAPPCTTADILAFPTFRIPAGPTGDVVRTSLGAFLQKNTFDPALFTQTTVNKDFHSPMAQQWSFSIQRQINRNNVAEIRYVGNHGSGLFQSINRNPNISSLVNGIADFGFGAFPAFPNLVPAGVTMQTCVDNAATPGVDESVCNGRILKQGLLRSRENTATSDYHGLQMRYNGRVFNQLTLGAAYTFSKTLDNASEIFSFGEGAFAQNPFDLTKGEKSLSGNDRRHAGSMNFIWDVPFMKSEKGLVGHVLGGWQFNGTYNLASGRTFTPSEFCNFACVGLGYQDTSFQSNFVGLDQLRPFAGSPNAPRTAVGITATDAGMLFFGAPIAASPTGLYSMNALNSTGTLVPVTVSQVRFIYNGPGAARQFGTPYGNVARNSERGPALNQLNIGIFKNTKIRENVRLQLRAELFNALNHPNPGFGVAGQDDLPDTTIEDAGNTPGLGQLNSFNDRRAMTLSSRRIQFGIRLTF
jgi:outer membrane receptor protein involved in Fe transport